MEGEEELNRIYSATRCHTFHPMHLEMGLETKRDGIQRTFSDTYQMSFQEALGSPHRKNKNAHRDHRDSNEGQFP